MLGHDGDFRCSIKADSQHRKRRPTLGVYLFITFSCLAVRCRVHLPSSLFLYYVSISQTPLSASRLRSPPSVDRPPSQPVRAALPVEMHAEPIPSSERPVKSSRYSPTSPLRLSSPASKQHPTPPPTPSLRATPASPPAYPPTALVSATSPQSLSKSSPSPSCNPPAAPSGPSA